MYRECKGHRPQGLSDGATVQWGYLDVCSRWEERGARVLGEGGLALVSLQLLKGPLQLPPHLGFPRKALSLVMQRLWVDVFNLYLTSVCTGLKGWEHPQ